MNGSIDMEIVRLLKEIANDEKDLRDAERWNHDDKIKRYTASMDRKLGILKILKEKA